MDKLIFFDLETQKSEKDVGGWANKRDMLISVAVTYSAADGYYHTYLEEDVDALVGDLTAADLVIGFNIKNFDYAVLSHYTDTDLSTINSLDLMEKVIQSAGHRVSLDNLAQATLGTKKLHASGLEAVQLFREGELFDLIAYCKQDVKLTKDLFEYGARNGVVFFNNQSGFKIKIPVEWKLNDF